MKRLLFLMGLLLALATPNLAQTKTDTLYFEFDIDPNADSSEFVYKCNYTGIEVEYYDGKTQGRFKAEAGEQHMPVYGKGYWRIYCTLPFEYKVLISPSDYYGTIRIREYGVYLTFLDVSRCSAMTELYCHNNELTALDVNGCIALTTLWCNRNQLTALDVNGCTALTVLDCRENQLTSLDVSSCTALDLLWCYDNQLTTLDISHNTALTRLNCYVNQLTSLDVSHNTALTSLHCSDNQMNSLDVSQNTALTYLSCAYNQLTSLDVSHNPALTGLNCAYNQLTSLNVSHNTALTGLNCAYNQLTSLDVSHNTDLTSLRCYYNHIPLRMLYKAYTQNDRWETFDADQKDTIFIQRQQLLDLSSERILGETISTFEISDTSGLALSSDAWTEKDFTFRFHQNGLYKLTLQNSSMINHYYLYSVDSIIEDPVTFTWYVSVSEYDNNGDAANENRQDDNDNLRVYTQDRTIHLSENRGTVQVFNTLGQCVYNGTSTSIPVRQTGVYIVTVAGKNYKVLVI